MFSDIQKHPGVQILVLEAKQGSLSALLRELNGRDCDIESERATAPGDLEKTLAEGVWDVLVYDNNSGILSSEQLREALGRCRAIGPVIVVSDNLTSEDAAGLVLAGAEEVVPGKDAARLIAAVKREILKARRQRRSVRAERERRALFEIIDGVNAVADLDGFLELVDRSIRGIVKAEFCCVILHEAASDTLQIRYRTEIPGDAPEDASDLNKASLRVFYTREPLLLNKAEILEMNGRTAEQGRVPAAVSWLGVPLRTPERSLGVLSLQNNEVEDAFSRDDLEFLLLVGDQVALVVERIRVQEALKRSERLTRELIENAADAIYSFDLEGNITSVNRAFETLTGFNQDEVLGMKISDLHLKEADENRNHPLKPKDLQDEPAVFESEIRDSLGRVLNLETTEHIFYEDGIAKGVQRIARDVTELRRRREQLLQSQKMDVVGQLAGGVAHDFNNLLTAINGYLDLAITKMAADDPVRRFMVEARGAGEKVATITNQLVAFSRKQVMAPRTNNLNEVIERLRPVLGKFLPQNVELRTELDPGLPDTFTDPNQMEQILMNLAVNARDAMPNGGTLTISTAYELPDEAQAELHPGLEPGRNVSLTVSDTGEGISPDVIDHVFEPFFTTKERGKGPGLGLSIVHGIVAQSGGKITVCNEEGGGAAFKVFLPVAPESSDSCGPAEGARPAPSAKETILLVEDNDMVRGLAVEIVRSAGYAVLEAENGPSALDLLEARREEIDLLVTDVIMPQMNGKELSDEVLKRIPGMKILYMSGYADDSVFDEGTLGLDCAFIEKPFTPAELVTKIRKIVSKK